MSEFDDRRGVKAPGAAGGVAPFLVATARDVVLEEATLLEAFVPAGEQGHDAQALHGRRQVAADHLAELVGLALEAQGGALDLLVVLEVELEQPDHLHRRSRRACDRNTGMTIGREDLLHRVVADEVAGGCPPIARHHHALDGPDGQDGGSVGYGVGF